jgi:hypothetical protein
MHGITFVRMYARLDEEGGFSRRADVGWCSTNLVKLVVDALVIQVQQHRESSGGRSLEDHLDNYLTEEAKRRIGGGTAVQARPAKFAWIPMEELVEYVDLSGQGFVFV